MKRKNIAIFVITIAILSVSGCNNKTVETTEPVSEETVSEDMAMTTEESIDAETEEKSELKENTETLETTDSVATQDFGYSEVEGGVAIDVYYGSAEVVEIPSELSGNSVVEIDGAFEGNTTMVKVIIPESVKNITEDSFQFCTALESVVFNGANIKEIVRSTFTNCKSLKEIELPSSIEVVGGAAFGGCSALTEIVIPESVTQISSMAFYQCESLVKIMIPENVTTIENGAFDECPNITIITPAGSYAEQYAKDNGLSVENE